ncbi:MAG: 3',5'-cyclic-AMP phosphodiesterase [Methylococcales bacterium]
MKSNSALTLKLNKNQRNDSVEVLQITDLHLLSEPDKRLLGVKTDETARQVIELAKSKTWPPDLIVLTGDLCQEPYGATYNRLDQTLQRLGVPCVCLPGNHDDPLLMQRELKSENVYYTTQILSEAWQIICLDSSRPESEAGHFPGKTLEILENHLDQYPEKFALVCLHHHPVSIGSAWLDTMVLDEKNKFFAILKSRSQCRAVACGHIHQALDITYENLQVFGTPSTCFQFKPGSENFLLDDKAPGYRRLCLHRDGTIETQVFRLPELPNGLNLLSSGYRK